MSVKRYAIDKFIVVRNAIIVDGWAEGHRPSITYQGKSLDSLLVIQRRPDLIAIFGDVAQSWGFSICALVDSDFVVHDDVSLLIGASKLSAGQLVPPEAGPKQKLFRRFQEIIAASPGDMIELGSRARSGNSYRDEFKGVTDYCGVDITDGPGVDIVADAHDLSKIISRKFKYAFSVSVFEHLLMPWKAAIELSKVMQKGGVAYIQSHHGWPLHEEPWDFWRFSDRAWYGLFNSHTGFKVLETDLELPGSILPRFALGGPLQNLDMGVTYLLSACLVEKISEPKVAWNENVSEIANLAYSHK